MIHAFLSPALRPAPPRRGAVWPRVVVAVIVLAAVLPPAALWVITRSWFIAGRVEPVLGRLLGGEVRIAHARYQGEGRFVFEDLALRARDVAGPGGEVCRIGSVQVRVDMDRLLAREVKVLGVDVEEMNVRLSEQAGAPGAFNFMSLTPEWSTVEAVRDFLPPRVLINRAMVEVGSHDEAHFTATGRRTLSGSMRPVPDEQGWYTLTAIEIDDRGEVRPEDALLVDGRWNVRTSEHMFHIKEVELNDRARAMCPNVALIWWDEMDLSGRVAGVDVRWSPREGFQVDFEVDDVGLTLPIDTTGLWARYRDGVIEARRPRARMQVKSGRIRLGEHSVTLERLRGRFVSADSSGDVVGIPYDVTVHIEDIPDVDWSDQAGWMARVLATAPFQMEFRTDDFRVEHEGEAAPPAVELPLAVAQVMEKFHLSDWVLSTGIRVTRAAPQPVAGGELEPAAVRSDGRAYITHAQGRYERFPYPLSAISAYLEFDNDEVAVRYLSGRGASGASVRLRGAIRSSGGAPSIDLQLTAEGVPVDEVLYRALGEREAEVFRSLLDRPSFERLSAAGLLIDGATIAGWREDLAAARDGGDAPRIRRLRTLIDRGPCTLGGTVDLDLHLQGGAGEAMRTTGRVAIDSLGLLYEGFPYPLRVTGGVLEVRENEVVIFEDEQGRGLPLATVGGGAGHLEGRIGFARGEDGTHLEPELRLVIEDEAINDLLLAAIPPSASERKDPAIAAGWPGRALARAARGLRELSLDGTLGCTAHFGAGEDGGYGYEIAIDLTGGEARPTLAISELLGRAPEAEPVNWRIEDCSGQVIVRGDGVSFENFGGRLETGDHEGRVRMSGRIDAGEPPDVRLDAHFVAMPLSRDLLALLAPAERARVDRWWRRYEPEGSFDADLVYRRRGVEGERVSLEVRPAEIRARMGEAVVRFLGEDGSIRIDRRAADFEDLRLRVDDGRGGEGRITLNDAVPLASGSGGEARSLRGRWEGGLFESPLVLEAMEVILGPAGAAEYAKLQPKGRFDAAFRYTPARGQARASYELRLHPAEVALQYRQRPVHASFDPGAEVVFSPGRITLHELRARHLTDRLEVGGVLETRGGLEATLEIAYEGRLRNSEVDAFLPEAVRRTLDSIDFRQGRASTLRHGRLHLRAAEPGGGGGRGERRPLALEFSGTLGLADASFRTGIEFSAVTGPIDITVSRGPDHPLHVELNAHPSRLKLLGQHLEDLRARLRLADDGRHVRLDSFLARARDGEVSASALVGIGPERAYTVSVQLVDVPVSDFLIRPPDRGQSAEAVPIAEQSGGLYANLALRGERGDRSTRIGRGVARVMDESLATIPLAIRLLQPFHATLPVGRWDYADARFYLRGDRVVFEHFLFESSLEGMFVQHLVGTGEMDLQTFDLNARFGSRGGVLLVRDLVGGIGDQLAMFQVTGPLWDPSVRVVALPALNPPPPSVVAAPRGARAPAP